MKPEYTPPRAKLFPCETPGCYSRCAMAFSCHNERMGQPSSFWPGIALLLLVGFAAVAI